MELYKTVKKEAEAEQIIEKSRLRIRVRKVSVHFSEWRRWPAVLIRILWDR